MFLVKPQQPRHAACEQQQQQQRQPQPCSTCTPMPSPAKGVPPAANAGMTPKPRRVLGLSARDWKYVAEGGANVLFRHHPTTTLAPWSPTKSGGSAAVEFRGKLLRVKKCDIAEQNERLEEHARERQRRRKAKAEARNGCARPTPKPAYPPHYPHPRQVLEYANKDILPYLVQQLKADDEDDGDDQADARKRREQGSEAEEEEEGGNGSIATVKKDPAHRNCFLQVAELIEVETQFLMELNEQLVGLEFRPPHRRHSQIDVGLQCVMVLPDVTLPPPDNNPLLFFDQPLLDTIRAGVLTDPDAAVVAPLEKESDDITLHSTDQGTDDEPMLDEAEVEAEASGDDTLELILTTEKVLRLNQRLMETTTITSDPSNGSNTTLARPLSIVVSEEDDDQDIGEDDDEEAVEGPGVRLLAASPPRLRRLLSSNHRNIFDCCFRNICVEIKPKIGFKPRGPWIPDIKKRACRFCMHQHYKKATGKVEEISEYCPLDLFSRNPDRVRKALRALQRTPQNNFKVFVRSNKDEVVNVITGLSTDALPKGASQSHYSYCRRKRMGFRHSCQSIGTENELMDAVNDGHETDHSNDHVIPDIVELMTEVLLKLDILQDLKKMQLLDHINVDGIWHLQKLLRRVEAVSSSPGKSRSLKDLVEQIRAQRSADREADTLDEDIEQAGSLKRCLEFLNYAIELLREEIDPIREVKSWEQLRLDEFQEFYRQLMQRFQVATTLKDCSLLLCLRRSADGKAHTDSCKSTHHHASKDAEPFDHLREYEHPVAFRDMVFDCVVAVVDLDVKSHKSVDDYYRLDEKIVQSFLKQVSDHGVPPLCCHED
ncbi:TPA: hypothetical protein N0F65_010688 [Lagenidium giganteum]|uniref:inositol-pentakisphosphate 2-kinase n=1 Tax=Lagenidium giganteum TaxID=4803 RepID=A0AAV2ZA07_9STRA|nr:TPA: hypothetical protein N0F65_010688 [Lagenidium giganteum]